MAKQSRPQSLDMNFPMQGVSFNVEAFDQLIRSQGVTIIHYKAILCPLGMGDKNDARAHSGHPGCNNGFIFKAAGELDVFFSQNQVVPNFSDAGIMDGSTNMVSLPRYYNDEEGTKPVVVQHYDRFYIKDVPATSVTTQRVEAHQSGLDRLLYPALNVEYIIDADGIEYENGVDFEVCSGNIKWIGKRPGFDPKNSRGIVYSIRYQYCPYYIVRQFIHEIRVSRDVDPITGELKLVRMPYSVLIQREYAFENEERNKDNFDNSNRVTPAPSSGGFGAR